jgi:hypothetical protein
MRTTVELPDSVYRKGERMARAEGVTMEEFIVRTLERELTIDFRTGTFRLFGTGEPASGSLEASWNARSRRFQL